MGLLDVLNGMQNGPRGPSHPGAPGSGMSKTSMALLAFLAYKAYKSFQGNHTQAGEAARLPRGGEPQNMEPGGLAGMLRTIFGGGPVPGNVLSRGVDQTIRDLDKSGHGDIGRSWVGRGQNSPITPQKLEAALGEDAIKDLMEQTGMDRDDLLATLSEHLPRAIDHLTPEGRIPTEKEASGMA